MNPRELERYFLGEFRVEEEPVSGDQLMIISSTLSSKAEADSLQANLLQRQKVKHPHLIDLRKVDRDEKRSWCSTTYQLRAAYEYFPSNLKKELMARRKKQMTFSSIELLRVVFDAIDSLAFLQGNDIKHGEVNPSLLFLYRDRFDEIQRVKICERFTGHTDKQLNHLHAMTGNLDLYLDPQTFESVAQGSKRASPQNPYKFANKKRRFLARAGRAGAGAARFGPARLQ